MGCAVSSEGSSMGASLRKKLKHSPANKDEGRSEDNDKGKLQTQSTNVSASQVNFFKMLDEKIENGIEFDEAAHEEEFRRELQRCVEEWDMVLAKSHDDCASKCPTGEASNATGSFELADNFSSIETKGVKKSKEVEDQTQSAVSVDSLRTMFSNSVGIPAGTLKESESEDVYSMTTSMSTSMNQLKGARPQSASIGGRRKIHTPPDSVLPRRAESDDDDTGNLNCSIRLSTVLQDRESSTPSTGDP